MAENRNKDKSRLAVWTQRCMFHNGQYITSWSGFLQGCCSVGSVERNSPQNVVFANHVASAKHKHSKLKVEKRESREKDIAEALAEYDNARVP